MAESNMVHLAGYHPGLVEVWGRRLKMEYVGMASVFTVIAVLIYGGPPWPRAVLATAASFFLFLGLKKKTRDHIMCSLLLFAAAVLARPAVLVADWALPLLLLGATVFALERSIEKRPHQVYALPVALAAWAWHDAFWLLGLLFASVYLLNPRTDVLEARPMLLKALAGGAVTGAIAAAARLLTRHDAAAYWPAERLPLTPWALGATGIAILVVLAADAVYWKRAIAPHRINPLVFGALAPWDLRLAAMFGMVGAVLMAATVFRQSIDSERLRPVAKHLEWHFFYLVLATAVWAVLRG